MQKHFQIFYSIVLLKNKKMLNKLEFNNLVIAHKDEIRQARIQTINKLVHKLRRLKDQKKPKELLPQPINKLEDKFTKITEIINQIKQLKGIHLMKNVLLLEKQPTAYITNASSTPSELSVAMLALNKIMASLINTFKLTLRLENTINPNWKTELQNIGKRKKKKENSRIRSRKKMKSSKKMKTAKNKQQKALDRRQSNSYRLMKNNIDDNSTLIAEKCERDVMKSDGNINDHTPLKVEDANNNDKRKSKVNPFNKNNVKCIHQDNELVGAQESEETLVMDPFFVTESGKTYLSTAKQNTNESYEAVNENKKMFKTCASKRQFPTSHRDNQNHHVSEIYNKNIKMNNIHPSWAAKQKPMIANFKGTKITFEQESDDQNELRVKTNFQNKCNIIENDNKNLHPSWAAKQKMRRTIAPFQGNKIVFNNDDE